MPRLKYLVKDEFSPGKQEDIHIRKKVQLCLALFKKGQIIRVMEFARKHHDTLTES